MNNPDTATISQIDWAAAKSRLRGKLSETDQQIVDLLVLHKSTPDIARALGTNRSAIWRRVQKIKAQLAG
jgi:hypothetical protein